MKGNMITRVVALSLFLAVIVVPRGLAQAARVFLSGTGSDAGDCSNAATPCRSLQGAIDQAAAGAEVVIVSSGGYGGATITKSITVNAPTGVIAFVGRTITVTLTFFTDTVTLRGLSMNGAVFGDSYGINFTAGGTLNVENTIISSFSSDGILDTATGSNLWVHNCDFKNNYVGVSVLGASAVIENSRAVGNHYGMAALSSSTVAIRNSVAEGNAAKGFYAFSSTAGLTEMVVDSCMSTNNGIGLQSGEVGTYPNTRLRAGQNIVMDNTGANLAAYGGSSLISQGGNRIGGATGGTTGFTSTVPQQ